MGGVVWREQPQRQFPSYIDLSVERTDSAPVPAIGPSDGDDGLFTHGRDHRIGRGSANCGHNNSSDVQRIAEQMQLAYIKSLIIDIDGVLWRGSKPLPGVADFFSFLQAHSVRFLIVTNNATRTAESLVERLMALGVRVSPDEILTSAKATALYLKQELPEGSLVLIVGEEGLLDALSRVGFRAVQADLAEADDPARAVVVGLDRGLTYRKLLAGTIAIRAGARFIATNTDATFPAEQGLVPGAGSMVAAVQTATSVTPTVIGKPYRPMFDAALDLLNSPKVQTAMLGDRLDTDIQGAQSVGLKTILVLTGVTTAEEANESTIRPDLTVANLVELKEEWESSLAKA